jgi:RNA 3'-phosphate cyclase
LISIDGSHGEGGGQILRTSLMFSLMQGVGVEVFNIRAKRENPGLRPQHLAVVRAFAEATGGTVENATVGSDRIRFVPAIETRSALDIDVGTAGSITLILQTLLPALSLKGKSCVVRVRGGTDTRWSPTFDYFKLVYEPAMQAVGIGFSTKLVRRGYYPNGGGIVEARCSPASPRSAILLEGGSRIEGAKIVSACSNLAKSVAERQAASAASRLEAEGLRVEETHIEEGKADSPGTSILVYHVEAGAQFVGGDAVGERGVRAEDVGKAAAGSFLTAATRNVAVDHHLADMLVPALAMQGGGEVTTDEATEHLRTNLEVAKAFTGCSFELLHEAQSWRVRVGKRHE